LKRETKEDLAEKLAEARETPAVVSCRKDSVKSR
jgi:hypothetical protein